MIGLFELHLPPFSNAQPESEQRQVCAGLAGAVLGRGLALQYRWWGLGDAWHRGHGRVLPLDALVLTSEAMPKVVLQYA